jgi:hypothetical protein
VLVAVSLLDGRSSGDPLDDTLPPPEVAIPGDAAAASGEVEPSDPPDPALSVRTVVADYVGFGRSEAGARRAAVAFLEATEDIVHLTPAEAAEAQRAISTTSAGERLASEVEQQMTDLRERTPQGVEVWIAPMNARSRESLDGYSVSVWYAEVVAVGTAIAVDNWRTVTYSLVWERNTWLIDEQTSIEGPVPSRAGGLTVTPPSTLLSILSDFNDDQLTPRASKE